MDVFSAKIAHAASLDTFLGNVTTQIINPLILFLFALAVLFFLYGVLQFIMNQDNEEAKTKGKSHMIWGIIGITIMMGVWAIMGMIINSLNIKGIDVKGGNIKVDLTP